MNTHLSVGRDVALTLMLIAMAFAACMVLAHFLDPAPPISAEPSPRGLPVSSVSGVSLTSPPSRVGPDGPRGTQ